MTKSINVIVRSLKDLQDRVEAHIKFNTSSGHNHNGTNSRLISLSSLGLETGSATIISGNTFVDVPHGLGYTPTIIFITPKELEGSINYWNTSGAVTFRINIGNSQNIDTHFSWGAK